MDRIDHAGHHSLPSNTVGAIYSLALVLIDTYPIFLYYNCLFRSSTTLARKASCWEILGQRAQDLRIVRFSDLTLRGANL